MSPSSTPTRSPSSDNAYARFAVSVDFPTPPLPDATATTRVPGDSEIVRSAECPPRRRDTSAAFSSGLMTSNPSRTRVTPGTSPTNRLTCSWNESRNGQPATVSAIVTETEPSSSTRTSRTMSSSVTGRRNSGSMTFSSAFRMASRSGLIAASVPAALRLTQHDRELPDELGRPGRSDPRAHAEIERCGGEGRILEQLDSKAAFADKQLCGGDVDRARRLQRDDAVDPAGGEMAQRQRERAHDPKPPRDADG